MPDDSGLSPMWKRVTDYEGPATQSFAGAPTTKLPEDDSPATPPNHAGSDSSPRDRAQLSSGQSGGEGGPDRPLASVPRARPVRPTAGPLRRLRSYVESGVGRRLMTMFILAGLVPVILLAGVSYLYVSRVMRAHVEDELASHTRQFAAAVNERLLWADSILQESSTASNARAYLAPRVGREFDGVMLLDRQGRLVFQDGQPPALDGFDLRALEAVSARPATALVASLGDVAGLSLVHAVADHPKIGFIAASLSRRFLWAEGAIEQSRFLRCALTTTGQRLTCPESVDSADMPLLAASAAAAKVMTVEAGGNRLLALPQPALINDHFAGSDLIFAALAPESELLQGMRGFYAAFLPASTFALVVVALIAASQVRRILVPLRRLLCGTQRVARRDFVTPVQVHSPDEFGQIARSFNAMAAELGLHFRTLSAFSEIDRTILTTVDMRQVADIALACIHEIAQVRVVSLGLLEADSPGATQVYLRGADGATVRETLPHPLDLSNVDSSLRRWSTSIRLPAAYRAMLRKRGTRYLYMLPIARADKAWGIVVLGHDQRASLSTEKALALAGVIDRLAVALSSVARDKQLHDQAHYDSLTGMPNRHYLMDMLSQQIRMARRESRMLAVLYIDLDRFKRINDMLGHAAGDVLLRKAASRIRRSVRKGDVVARLGGDEFTVVLPHIKEAADAGSVARTLIGALNQPFEIEGSAMYAGGSVGIAIFPKDGETSAELLKKADIALYRAKDRGRGRYAFFEERMNADASARVTVDRELREALRRGEFRLYYQPQIDLATGEVCAVEALLRWQHPQQGLVGPESFIDYAEESGLIEPIGTWVLREACEQHRRWVEQGVVISRVSINVSPVQLRNPSFAAVVEGALASSTTAARHLELEVTESLLVDAGPDAVAILERLRELGIEIAVDDFGTGYSSFAYVKQLPASVLKLDRAFLIDVIDNPQAAIIARAIFEMANALGKIVVAEGVETLQQVEFLRRNRCARAQGFAFCQPLPPEQVPDFVRERQREPDTIGRNTRPPLAYPKPMLDAA